jgi:Protein of unknown function (DUF732)
VTRRLLGCAALILAALVVAPVASSEPGAYSQEDDWFYRSLTEGTEDSPGIVLTNPPLVRAQGLQACQRIDDGVDPVDASDMLMAEGPYSWDVASSIVASATVFLCPEVRY